MDSELVMKELGRIGAILEELRRQVTIQNGRVAGLEDWRHELTKLIEMHQAEERIRSETLLTKKAAIVLLTTLTTISAILGNFVVKLWLL